MENLNLQNLHHAYFIVGERVENLFNFFKKAGIKTQGNPDFLHFNFKTLTIDNARMLAERENRKSENKKFFVIETDFITEEAQNAMLKVFEEPTAGTCFFIVSPQDILLPTLRSRMHVIQGSTSRLNLEESVLNLKLYKRLAKVKEITEAIADEEKTKQDAIVFLNNIESQLYSRKEWKSLKICEEARQALYDRGAPVKMILEQVILSV